MLSITMVRTQYAGGKRQYAQYYNGEDSMCRGQKAVCSVLRTQCAGGKRQYAQYYGLNVQGAKGSMLSITMVRTQCAGGKRQYYNGEDSMCRGQKAVCSVLQW